ncbi:MAG: hypothetical protein FD180_811 [Planctomycetota bacterium]|nr:MAG: hypothetical protein FD180_811 [Planctomycetota bacterium]
MRHPLFFLERNDDMKRLLVSLATVMLAACSAIDKSGSTHAAISWQPWSDAAFEAAKRERKLVLLDLGAVWCHWCHVMDRETYGDPEVAKYVGEHFIAIHVNQDERPDLANRYEDYGWPATILFAADGTELGKFRGFMPPKRLLALFGAFVADPTPGPSALGREPVAAADAILPRDLDNGLHGAWEAAYDRKEQGWGSVLKYLDPDCVELAMAEGRDDMARGTLDAMLQLIDPVWGGVYQYSHGGVWTNPHFEKIMSFQAEDMRIYALAHRVYGDEKYLRAARDIERYLLEFLRSPDGAFYASQDADLIQGEHSGEYFALADAGRRARGLPRIDTHLYARENGWAVAALASLSRASGDPSTLKAAVQGATWVLKYRGTRIPMIDNEPSRTIVRHDGADSWGQYLADALAFARACIELSQATGDDSWISVAIGSLSSIRETFRSTNGYVTAASLQSPLPPLPQVDENIGIARLASRVFHLTGDKQWKEMAEHAMKYLAGVARDANGVRAAGILLAAREFASEPVKVVVVGDPGDQLTEWLLRAARSAPATWLVVSRVDPGASAEYVQDGGVPTAYVCTDAACNGPFHDPEALRKAASPPRRR